MVGRSGMDELEVKIGTPGVYRASLVPHSLKHY
jgi:hypothetical protein